MPRTNGKLHLTVHVPVRDPENHNFEAHSNMFLVVAVVQLEPFELNLNNYSILETVF